jgi:hypothetical protein
MHRAKHELPWARGKRAVDHLGVKSAQILADKRFRDQLVSEFGEESIDSGLSLGMRPIISNAVAETEVPLQSELVDIALIIFTPVIGLLQHQGFHGGGKAALDRRRVENARYAIKPVECFA